MPALWQASTLYGNARLRRALWLAGQAAVLKKANYFPNDDAIIRLVGTLLLEQNDEWAAQRCRYMTLETMTPLSDDAIIRLPVLAR